MAHFKRIWLSVVLLCASFALAAPVITPLNPAVYLGQTAAMTCTANCGTGGRWSVTGAGSIDASTGLYAAPASVTAKQTLGGYQLLPNNHIFNADIASAPLNPNSASMIGSLTTPVEYIFSFPVNLTNNSTPTQPMTFYCTPANNGNYQVPTWPRLENGYYSAQKDQSGDHHFVKFNTQSGAVEEQYQFYRAGLNSSCPTCNSQSGLKYQSPDYALPANLATDAAGMFLSPLLLRVQGTEQACANSTAITHALRMAVPQSQLLNQFIWPATSQSGWSTGVFPYGTRVRLNPSYDISGFSPCAQVMLTQMKDYGLFMTDAAGLNQWDIYLEFDGWPASTVSALDSINNAGLTPQNFQVVDESGLEISAASGEANANRETVCYTSSTGSSCTDVVLEGVAVNLPQNRLYIMAGTPAQQLAALVHDGASNTVTWAMSPSVGTLTSGGLYTAPTSISSTTCTTITATSTVDPTVAASMTVWVFPFSGFYGLSATATPYTDTGENVWNAGVGYGTVNSPAQLGCCNHDPLSPAITNHQLFDYQLASSPVENDINTSFLVPAGIYRVTMNLGVPQAAGNMEFIAQGNVLASGIDPAVVAGGTKHPYTYTTVQGVGSDNNLSFRVWGSGLTPWRGGDISSISVVPVRRPAR